VLSPLRVGGGRIISALWDQHHSSCGVARERPCTGPGDKELTRPTSMTGAYVFGRRQRTVTHFKCVRTSCSPLCAAEAASRLEVPWRARRRLTEPRGRRGQPYMDALPARFERALLLLDSSVGEHRRVLRVGSRGLQSTASCIRRRPRCVTRNSPASQASEAPPSDATKCCALCQCLVALSYRAVWGICKTLHSANRQLGLSDRTLRDQRPAPKAVRDEA
jgi:hypothetical protein